MTDKSMLGSMAANGLTLLLKSAIKMSPVDIQTAKTTLKATGSALNKIGDIIGDEKITESEIDDVVNDISTSNNVVILAIKAALGRILEQILP